MQSCQSAFRILVFWGSLGLSVGPVWSQPHDQNVRMVMSNLPSITSANYLGLRKRAGEASIQVLPLTKAEMWSVPPGRVASVKSVAARLGVSVNDLAANWNQLFRPMPGHRSPSLEHKRIIASYSLAHEIGHLIGARHELAMDGTLTPFPYGHGYVNGTKWRDIMSYKDTCGGCPRLPIWSNPNVLVRGEPAGAANANNARVVAEQAARVANFRSSRNKHVYISGPAPGGATSGTADHATRSR